MLVEPLGPVNMLGWVLFGPLVGILTSTLVQSVAVTNGEGCVLFFEALMFKGTSRHSVTHDFHGKYFK